MIKKILFNLIKFVAPVVLIAVGVYIANHLISTKPKSKKAAVKQQPALVETMSATFTDEKIIVPGLGTILPAREVVIQPEASGLIIQQNPSLIPGGILKEGDLIARIDPRDYEYAVAQQEAAVETAAFNVKVEEGRKTVAEREWKLLGNEVATTDLGRELALREPHIQNVKAILNAAQSRLQQAKLQLQRTNIHAPFNCIVREENIDTGQYVTPQTRIATLVGTDQYWVKVAVSMDHLRYIRIPTKAGEKGSPVTLIQEAGLSDRIERQGYVIRLLSDLDIEGRRARLLIAIDDPLQLTLPEEERTIPLVLNAYVRADIEGSFLSNICVLPRTALREGDKIWIMNSDNELEIHPAEILWRQEDSVFIRNHFEEGDHLARSC